MNYGQKNAIVTLANERRGAISDAKGPEYAGQAEAYTENDQDVLANFKRQDARWGYDGSGLCSAFLYFGKHLDSIETYARNVKPLLAAGDKAAALELGEKGEGIISRLDDARNYVDLIECLLVDADLHPVYLPDFLDVFDDEPTDPDVYEAFEPCGPDCSCQPVGQVDEPGEDTTPSLPPELSPAGDVDLDSGEPLYRIDGTYILVTEREGRACIEAGVRPINYRVPKKDDRYLLLGAFGWRILTALADHGIDGDDASPYLILPAADVDATYSDLF